MADYQISSQLRGPNIDISLFPQAMQAGVQVGNAMTTPLEGLAQGITQGIQNEQTVRQNEANIAYRQAQVEQMPLEMQIKQQQLENQKAETDVNLLRAQIEQMKLKNETDLNAAKAQNELSEQRGIGVVNGALASQDPIQLNGLLGNKDALNAMNSDQKLREAVTGRALSMLPPGEERDAWVNYDSAQKQMDRLEKERKLDETYRAKRQGALDKAVEDATAVTSAVLHGRDLSTIKNIELYPEGLKKTDANGKILQGQDDLNGLPPRAQQFYEVFENGKKVPGMTVPVQDFEKWTKLKDAYSSVFGGSVSSPQAAQTPQAQAQNAPVALHQGVSGQELQGVPGLQTPKITGNDRIVQQKIEQYNSQVLKNVPEGLSAQALERRRQTSEQNIQQRLRTPMNSMQAVEPPRVPISAAPQKSNVALTETLGLGQPAMLHLTSLERPETSEPLPKWTPDEKSWTRINTNPVTAKESGFIKGMVYVESGGNSAAVSDTGVRGLMQVTRAVAQSYGLNRDIPEENLLAGKKYISDLLTQFNGDYRLALTAYNAGPGVVREAVRESGSTDWPVVQQWLKDNLSAQKYKEVSDYANKVIYASTHFVQKGNPADEEFVSSLTGNGLVKVGGLGTKPPKEENMFNKPLEEVLNTPVEETPETSEPSQRVPLVTT